MGDIVRSARSIAAAPAIPSAATTGHFTPGGTRRLIIHHKMKTSPTRIALPKSVRNRTACGISA